MARINAVLDDEVDYGFEGGPEYNTNEVDLENGFSERDGKKKFGKHRFNASFGNIGEDLRDYLISVFHACRGKLHSFMFKDWNDYTVDDQVIQVEAGTSNKIQLYKVYQPLGWPAYTIRPIQALAPGAEIIDENGDPVPGSFNNLTGEFTPVGMWGDGEYRLTCEFFVWVYFTNDYNSMTINAWRDHTADVELLEDPIKVTATNLPLSWDG